MQVVRDLELNNWWVLERYVGCDLSDVSKETQCWTCSKCLTVQGETQKKIVFHTESAWMSEFWSDYTACMRDHPFATKPASVKDKISNTLPLIRIPVSRIFQRKCSDYTLDNQ